MKWYNEYWNEHEATAFWRVISKIKWISGESNNHGSNIFYRLIRSHTSTHTHTYLELWKHAFREQHGISCAPLNRNQHFCCIFCSMTGCTQPNTHHKYNILRLFRSYIPNRWRFSWNIKLPSAQYRKFAAETCNNTVTTKSWRVFVQLLVISSLCFLFA